MQVILLKDIQGIGKKDDIVKVSKGYGANFLFPRKLAVEATEVNMKRLEKSQADAKEALEDKIAEATVDKEKLEKESITIKVKSGETGRIFGSVTNQEIATAIKDQKDLLVDRRRIVLPEAIKDIGRHEIEIKLYGPVSATVVVVVEAE